MDKAKRDTFFYWILILLVLTPTAGSGILELFTHGPGATIQAFQRLGYPLYLMKILGLAKILGALAILSGSSATLKEWAYAGFTFNFLGATASHLLSGDAAHAPIPFAFFMMLMGAYFLSRRRA